MNTIKNFILLSVILLGAFSFASCDDDNNIEISKYQTIFSVYESNEDYKEGEASRFVSEGAIISIWVPSVVSVAPTQYSLVAKIKTASDGRAIYPHDYETLYYSVEKEIDNKHVKRNLFYLPRSPQTSHQKGYQIAGIFTSEDDIKTQPQYNISDNIVPKVGSFKLKDFDLNHSIDNEDAVTYASTTQPEKEVSVYIATTIETESEKISTLKQY